MNKRYSLGLSIFYALLYCGIASANASYRVTVCKPAAFYASSQKKQDTLKSIVFDYKKQKWFVAVQCGKPLKKVVLPVYSLEFAQLTQAQNFYKLLKSHKVIARFMDEKMIKIYLR